MYLMLQKCYIETSVFIIYSSSAKWPPPSIFLLLKAWPHPPFNSLRDQPFVWCTAVCGNIRTWGPGGGCRRRRLCAQRAGAPARPCRRRNDRRRSCTEQGLLGWREYKRAGQPLNCFRNFAIVFCFLNINIRLILVLYTFIQRF
jgi:hypothetical protein